MTAVPVRESTHKIIELELLDGKLHKKAKEEYNKDNIAVNGQAKRAGVSSEVYPFNTSEEIKAMIDILDKHINEAMTDNQRMIACRNKMLFLIGINIGLRASDLVALKWEFFFDDNGDFKDFYTLQPKKTRKQKKFVKLFFNQVVKKAIADYIEEYPIEDMSSYLFKSRKGNSAITEKSLWQIIVDTASEAGIKKNVGSHSLRKTFGFWAWHNAEDKNKALVTLQMLFNHSDASTTLRYIGILSSEIEDMFNNVDLGLDYI